MLIILLLIISDAASLTNSGVSKLAASRYLSHSADTATHVVRVSITTCITLMLATLFPNPVFGNAFYQLSGFTALFGVLFGLIVALQGNLNVRALAAGPLSLTTLISSCVATMVPVFAGSLFWKETISLKQWIGIALLLCAMVLLMNPKLDKRITKRWCFLTLFSSLCGGSVGVMQKIHQSSEHKGERAGFLVVAFAVYAVVMLFVSHASRKHVTSPAPWFRGKIVLLGAIVGVCTTTVHLLNLYLSGALSAVIVFPLLNGIPLLGSMLIGIIFFREKVKLNNLIGFIIGILSLLLVSQVI